MIYEDNDDEDDADDDDESNTISAELSLRRSLEGGGDHAD